MANRLSSADRIQVAELVSSRYGDTTRDRPESWDSRIEGIDTIRSVSGDVVKLKSSAMQSPPKLGWVLYITGGDAASGFTWTLYGMPRHH